MPTPIELRDKVIAARTRYYRGEIRLEELYAVCDEYIEAVRQYHLRHGRRRVRLPSRAYLLRAF